MRFVHQIAALLFIIALPIALITTNVRIVVNAPRVYEYAADHYNTAATTQVQRAELLRASRELRAYFNNDETTASILVVRNGQAEELFNSREVEHLRDVKALFQTTFRVQEGAVIFILAYVVMVFLWARERSLRRLAREVLTSGLLSISVLTAFGLVAVTGFDAAFERFHLIAFNNDLWRLDPDTDRLIQMFPEAFWYDVTLWVVIATFVQLTVLALIAGVVLLLTREDRIRSVKITGALQAHTGAEGQGTTRY